MSKFKSAAGTVHHFGDKFERTLLVSGAVSFHEPIPATSADIHRHHVRLVKLAACRFGCDEAAIADWLLLPAWNVRRCLIALGMVDVPPPEPGIADVVAAALAAGPLMVNEIAARIGKSTKAVTMTLNNYPERFRVVAKVNRGYRNRGVSVWGNVE
jgi:hypothetical protein